MSTFRRPQNVKVFNAQSDQRLTICLKQLTLPSNIIVSNEPEGKLRAELTYQENETIATIHDPATICRLVCVTAQSELYRNFNEFPNIDNWLALCDWTLVEDTERRIRAVVKLTIGVLKGCEFICGKRCTLADIFIYCLLNNVSDSEGQLNTYLRKIETLFKLQPKLAVVHTQQDRGKFSELDGAENGKVVVRFPPEASGFLHIGHVKAALLNQFYRENYSGKLILRFDDTNPEKETNEFENAILEDCENLLCLKPDIITRTSDHFGRLIDACTDLIQQGKAYCDDTDQEQMKKERENLECSKCRNQSVEQNLSIWKQMRTVKTNYCVRAKIDYKSPNGCMRDPCIFRWKDEAHTVHNNRYKVYPTYDFACPLVDSWEGVTHALRTTEYHDRDEQYAWFIEALKVRPVHISEFSRLNLQNTVLSKRKLAWFVNNKKVSGWDDPRMPTLRGVFRRGMTLEGLKDFIHSQGSSKSNVNMEWDKVWAMNTRIIDPKALRYTALLAKHTVNACIKNIPQSGKIQINLHPKNPDRGFKSVRTGPNILLDGDDVCGLSEGDRVTLIGWGNMRVISLVKGNKTVDCVILNAELEDKDFRKTKKLNWLCVSDSRRSSNIPVVCIHFENLISKAKLSQDDDFRDYAKHKTKFVFTMIGEASIANVKKGEIIQLQRRGFFICDQPYSQCSPAVGLKTPCILINIPDGSTKLSPTSLMAVRGKIGSFLHDPHPDIASSCLPIMSKEDDSHDDKTISAPEQKNIPKAKNRSKVDKKKTDSSISAAAVKKPKTQDKKQSDSTVKKPSAAPSVSKQTRLCIEFNKETDTSSWYSEVITKAEMIEYYDVSGCYIMRPWSFAIWEYIRDYLDGRFKLIGIENSYFPLFVSRSALQREQTHIADFAPEVAWVTRSGNSEMAEPIAVRPTSETVMYPAYSNWIKSYRDLPLRLNQWNNVVRWEFKHPTPFLRSREFLWQEGHTAFLDQNEAFAETREILDLYEYVYEQLLAVPVVKGRKSEKEKFAGADYSLTVEAFVPSSGRGIQGATSHHLGQNFSKMFDIKCEHPTNGNMQYVFQNSWGITTRTIGVMIMLHGDGRGLVLPPRVARYQVVLVPCGLKATTSKEDEERLICFCKDIVEKLTIAGIRTHMDDRTHVSPGWKFNHWELKGVPLRLEVGFKEVETGVLSAARRDTLEKSTIEYGPKFCDSIQILLDQIHDEMLDRSRNERNKRTIIAKSWREFVDGLRKKCLLLSPFCGDEKCETDIKARSAVDAADDTENGPQMGAKSLCFPFDAPDMTKEACFACGKKEGVKCCLFGRSY